MILLHILYIFPLDMTQHSSLGNQPTSEHEGNLNLWLEEGKRPEEEGNRKTAVGGEQRKIKVRRPHLSRRGLTFKTTRVEHLVHILPLTSAYVIQMKVPMLVT